MRKIVLLMSSYYSNQSSWPFEQVPVFGRSSFLYPECLRGQSGRGSVSDPEKDAVKRQAQAPEEKQRRAVLRHQRKDRSRQRNFNGLGVAGRKIVNDPSEEHVKKSAANLMAAIRSCRARELYLRNRFAAKRTLCQMSSNVLAAEYTAALIRNRSCHGAHTAVHRLSL